MAEKKYAKYILKGGQTQKPAEGGRAGPVALKGLKDWGGIGHRMEWTYIKEPVVMEEEPHFHDFDEFLCILGPDPTRAFDLGATIELSLGKEGEKQTIENATIVCLPKGLIHGPLNFKNVSRPVLFSHIYLAPNYTRKKVSK